MHASDEKKTIGTARMAGFLVLCAIAAPGGIAYDVDPGASRASVHVGKTGLASFAGHEPELAVGPIPPPAPADPHHPAHPPADLPLAPPSLRPGPPPRAPPPPAQPTTQAATAPALAH